MKWTYRGRHRRTGASTPVYKLLNDVARRITADQLFAAAEQQWEWRSYGTLTESNPDGSTRTWEVGPKAVRAHMAGIRR